MEEAITRKPKPVIKKCNGCRKEVVIVKRAFNMHYGECCKHKAPTKEQFEAYKYANTPTSALHFTEDDEGAKKHKKRSGQFEGH